MNLLLLEEHEVDGEGRAVLGGRRAEHLRKVLKVTVGKTLRAGLVDGPRGTAEVLGVEAGTVRVVFRAEETREEEGQEDEGAGDRPQVDLVVALPRPQVLHRVLQTVASMGVRRLDLVNAWRVEKSYFHSPSLGEDKIRRQLRLGAEQGMTTRLPEVRLQPLLVPFVRSLAAGGDLDAAPLRLLAHPDAELDLEEAVTEAARPVQLAVGAEGGWIDREVETLRSAGFRPVRLGPWVLRVEVALAVALGQLAVARRRVTRAC